MDTKTYLKNIEEVIQERKYEEYFSKSAPIFKSLMERIFDISEKSKYALMNKKDRIDAELVGIKREEIVFSGIEEKICIAGKIIEKGRTKADV